jgi:hypothetical protein
MDCWQAMRIFVKVAETESFAATARHMIMRAPAVTRFVAPLGAQSWIQATSAAKRGAPLCSINHNQASECGWVHPISKCAVPVISAGSRMKCDWRIVRTRIKWNENPAKQPLLPYCPLGHCIKL